MTGRATIAKTRSGRPRVNVDPAALAASWRPSSPRSAASRRCSPLPSAARPPGPAPMRSPVSRGPGQYRPEPFVMAQASSNADPWAGDIEHSESYMEAIRTGQNIGELRRRSADDAMQRAIAHQPPPVIWESPAFAASAGPPPRARAARAVPRWSGTTQRASGRPGRPAPCSRTGPSFPITSRRPVPSPGSDRPAAGRRHAAPPA